MDLQDFDGFNCSICFDLFGEGPRCPRMLSCGHTYCHACLEKLLVGSKHFCPTCKVEIQTQRVELIPINYIVKSFIKKMAVKESDTGGDDSSQDVTQNVEESEHQSVQSILKFTKTSAQRESKYLSEGYCEEHESFKFLRCMTCNLWVCGVCATVSHKQCRTLLVKEALTEMKDGISQKARLEREFQKSETSTADRLIKIFEDRRKEMKRSLKKLQQELKKEIEKFKAVGKYLEKLVSWKREQNKCCDKLESLDALVLRSSDYSDFTKVTNSVDNYLEELEKNNLGFQIQMEVVSNLNSDDIKLLCEEEAVYCCRHQGERTQYGKVEISNGSVWVHSFCTQRPDISTVLVPFRQLQRHFGVLETLPQRAFLKMSCEDSAYGDVVIATDGLCSRAKNFLFRCEGISRHSYKGCQTVYNDERSEATFRFAVPIVSKLKNRIFSLPCFVRNLPWSIYVECVTNEESQKCLAIYLVCKADSDYPVSWSVEAEFELRLLSVKQGHAPYKIKAKALFSNDAVSWGFRKFMSLDDVLDPKNGYIIDDTITIETWISIETPNGNFSNVEKRIGYFGVNMSNQARDTTPEMNNRNSLLKAMTSDGVCEAPTGGFVFGFPNETVSDFSICIEDASSAPLFGKFGEVKTGMDVLQKVMKDLAAGKKVTIKDCGIIL